MGGHNYGIIIILVFHNVSQSVLISKLNQPTTGNLDSKSCHLLQRKGVAALSLLCGYEGGRGVIAMAM